MKLDDKQKQAEARKAAWGWWAALQPDPERGQAGDRAALAMLRRAATPLQAAEQAASVQLARTLEVAPREFEDVAVCAAVLAHVRQDDPRTPAARSIAVDPKDPAARPLLSPLRFRRLIEARDAGDRLIQFRRLVALAGGALNVADLAVAVLDWSDMRRRDWIFLYHGGDARAHAAPTPSAGEPA